MKKFLLIDDDDIFNLLNSKVIENTYPDASMHIFTEAQDALQYLEHELQYASDIPDLIFVDVRMPFLDGFEFLEAFHQLPFEKLRGIPIYMLTSSLDERDQSKASQFPQVLGFYSKPLTVEILKQIEGKMV